MQKTNPVLREAIQKLDEAGRKNDAAVYSRAAEELQNANRKQVEVNLSTIQRHADDGDTVLVPGKVLGSGRLTKAVTVAAFDFTSSARQAVNDAGEVVHVEDLVDENPDGEQVRLLK
ncbi:MAG: 50S ribosomal protein L18e [Candidatus Nanohaloarchaea archaeon]|nr:50S ribosomal protein L18e [Candidatus Nanohaloarchaea archaeon]